MIDKAVLRNAISVLALALCIGGCNSDGVKAPIIPSGSTEADALRILGQPDSTTTMTMADGVTFINHIFLGYDRSILIDSRDGSICEIGIVGSSDGYCYPCSYGPSAGQCN